jgi:hypothetical protein
MYLWNRPRWILPLLMASFAVLSASQARATIIGLGDGTYDVTLTCIVIDCVDPIAGSLTVSGNDVTDWSFAFPVEAYGAADVFSGNPQETILPFDEIVRGVGSFGSELVLSADNEWGIFQSGIDLIRGTWTAELQDTPQGVPEPASAFLILSGLGATTAAAALRRRR